MKTFILALATVLFASPAFAVHIYVGSNCSNAKFELNYDGPGSNYPIGGYHRLYSRKQVEGKQLSTLAFELDEANGETATLGEKIADQTLHVLFRVKSYEKTSKSKPSLKAGDTCEPDEFDYQHTEWTARETVEIVDISSKASARFGLKKGDKLKLVCNDSQDMPVRCPSTGKYSEEDVAE